MSVNFSLALSNPDAPRAANIAYINLPDGNTLDLVISNSSGFAMTIGGESTATYLLVRISSNVLDAAGAGSLTVAAPWTIESHTPASQDEPFFTFSLLPPKEGVTLPDGGKASIELGRLAPSAVGTGQVRAAYEFDVGDELNASASLSVVGRPDPDLPSLIGADTGLLLTRYVNDGSDSNPVMVSAAPATSGDAVDNRLQLNFLFKAAPAAPSKPAARDNSALVDKWDPLQPPSFRVFFPYFDPADDQPARLDLTDSRKPGDTSYNSLTSAWSIRGSLDHDQSSITENDFWQITLDPTATMPVWLITPKPENANLFTVTESTASEPGPFLDLYFSDIVSDLPVDDDSAETILYIQWTNFPGFRDGVLEYPLRKTRLAVKSFSGTVMRELQGPMLVLQWDTDGADHCELTGESGQQPTSAQGDDYKRLLTSFIPLQSRYTLAAVGKDGVTRATRTISARWQVNTSIPPTPIDGASLLQVSPDGEHVLVLCGRGKNAAVAFFDPESLSPQPLSPVAPGDATAARSFVTTRKGETLLMVSLRGAIFGYDTRAFPPTQTPGSGRRLNGRGEPPFMMAVSPDDSQVVVLPLVDGRHLYVLTTGDLEPVSDSPVPIEPTAVLAIGPQTGRYYLCGGDGVFVLDSGTHNAVGGSPVTLTDPGLLAIARDESTLFTISADIRDNTFVLSRIDAANLCIKSQLLVGLGFNWLVGVGLPSAGLAVSADGAVVFLIGLDLKSMEHDPLHEPSLITRFVAYDAQTLAQLGWSPLSFPADLLPAAIAVAPEGSRLFVLAGGSLRKDQNIPVALFAVDPEFT